MKKNVREVALDLLVSVENNQSYSNLLLNQSIKKNNITGPDVGLLTEITYGTLQRKQTLDFYLSPFLQKKIEKWVQILLRIAVYQMVYLDKVPDRAVIYEAVELAKKKGHRGISGMVNGVLRSIQRKGLPSIEEITNPIERLAVETSHPFWLVEKWVHQFGYEKTEEMCRVNLTAPSQTARVNLTKTSVIEVLKQLEEEGFQAEESTVVPNAIRSLKGNLAFSECFNQGLITIQDESSMLVGFALQLEEGQRVLDCCAAPGGKTTHIGELLRNTGSVTALDLHKHKVKLIEQNATRLQLSNIRTQVMDSRTVTEHFEENSFDRILVDAPCSGFGVVRRKPDIKYAKTEQDILRLQEIQLSILQKAACLLKENGILVYSTCTVDKEENEDVIQKFLKETTGFELIQTEVPATLTPAAKKSKTLQVFPQDFGSDGFYIATLKKRGS